MFGVFQPRQRLFAKISRLNADGEYRRVIALIESHRGYENDYELVGLLAQAYIDYAHPSMDAFNDLLQSAVNLLASTQAQGAGDPLWNQRMGVALYWLDRNEEAVPYLRHSLELNPSDSTTSTFLQRCDHTAPPVCLVFQQQPRVRHTLHDLPPRQQHIVPQLCMLIE